MAGKSTKKAATRKETRKRKAAKKPAKVRKKAAAKRVDANAAKPRKGGAESSVRERKETAHTVQTNVGTGYRVKVSHKDYTAIQYEFYIPEAIWNHPSIKIFIQRLESVEPSATIFRGLIGVWQGEPETTRIYRLILRRGRFDPNNSRAALHGEVGRLMADLSASPQHAQQTFMFSETDIRATESMNVTRI
jgi:hypothetical protein